MKAGGWKVNSPRGLVPPAQACGHPGAGGARGPGHLVWCPLGSREASGLWICSRKGPRREHGGSAPYCTPKLHVLNHPQSFSDFSRFREGPSWVALAEASASVSRAKRGRPAGSHHVLSGLSRSSCPCPVCAPALHGGTKWQDAQVVALGSSEHQASGGPESHRVRGGLPRSR